MKEGFVWMAPQLCTICNDLSTKGGSSYSAVHLTPVSLLLPYNSLSFKKTSVFHLDFKNVFSGAFLIYTIVFFHSFSPKYDNEIILACTEKCFSLKSHFYMHVL